MFADVIPKHSIMFAFSYCDQAGIAMPNFLEYLFSSCYLNFFSSSSLLEYLHIAPRTCMTSERHIESVLTLR